MTAMYYLSLFANWINGDIRQLREIVLCPTKQPFAFNENIKTAVTRMFSVTAKELFDIAEGIRT